MSFTFDELRESYKNFIYKSYDIEPLMDGSVQVRFYFEIEGLDTFSTRWVFPNIKGDSDLLTNDGKREILERFVFDLGMAESISYWKIACPYNLIVKAGNLTKWQNDWWKKLYYKGLGEFQYVNGIKIEMEDFINIEADTDMSKLHDDNDYSGVLVPVGGGKDSVVTMELLKNQGIITYAVNENSTTINVVNACNYKEGHIPVKRILDKKVLEYNEKGYLNGHIPFSSVVAFSTVITSFINGIKYVALSNESSANESTVKDSFVNHQYSKSYEFEEDFTEYIKNEADSDIHYFSNLRPLKEIQIAYLFSKATDYHKVFRSCNKGSKLGIWCDDCPKCLFVYIVLAPFLTEDKMIEIFGEKLLDKESLDKDFRGLCGIDENKPFECVGTRNEVVCAMKDYILKGGKSLLTDRYKEFLLSTPYTLKEMLSSFEDMNNVPEDFLNILKNQLFN